MSGYYFKNGKIYEDLATNLNNSNSIFNFSAISDNYLILGVFGLIAGYIIAYLYGRTDIAMLLFGIMAGGVIAYAFSNRGIS